MDRFDVEHITAVVKRRRETGTLVVEMRSDKTSWSQLDGVRGVKMIAREDCGILLTDEEAEEICEFNGWQKYPE
ncbi:hypothetical protein [Ktedonospora formicarum]|uniref:Uncharacterized protein n=1 Tax=Ktedonospora formicarum TaxID=2778364 RepID=A0A8J3I8T6_9CHLR|nr:hypothetical protein [Ktedonospora formicarum]GHO49561.1 hypothetical protein KSX_77240 [Ktedonospora formicarum]